MKIWLLTWNLEYQKADTSKLDLAGKIATAGNDAPDLIITAQQEATGPFIEDVRLAGYDRLTAATIRGITKRESGHCHTHLGVMVKRGMTPTNITSYTYEGGYGKGKKSIGSKFIDLNLKGGAMAEFTFNENRCPYKIGICGAHLDAKGGAPREKQIDRTLASLYLGRRIKKTLRAKTNEHNRAEAIAGQLMNRYDLVFYLGDLNYRIGKVTEPNGTEKRLSETDFGRILTRKNVSGIDLARLQSFDLNTNSKLITSYGFTFPQYTTNNFPTYKINYENHDGRGGRLDEDDVQDSLNRLFAGRANTTDINDVYP